MKMNSDRSKIVAIGFTRAHALVAENAATIMILQSVEHAWANPMMLTDLDLPV